MPETEHKSKNNAINFNSFRTLKTALYHHRKSTENDAKFSEYIVLGVPLWQQTVTEMQKRTTVLGISFNHKRCKHLTACQKMDGYFIDGENNQIEIIENEKVSLLPRTQKIEGLFVRLTGSNNIIRLHKPFKFINSSIFVVDCKNAVVEIGENSACNTLVVRNNGGVNRNCYIGKNFSCWGCEILLNGRGNSVYVGDDCLFSKEIHIMNGDGHPLYVMGEEWKPQTDVRIGNNVWMGMGAWVLKNVSIADGCVIGAASVVTKSFYKKNSALAGNPAHVVKENIIWLRSPKR